MIAAEGNDWQFILDVVVSKIGLLWAGCLCRGRHTCEVSNPPQLCLLLSSSLCHGPLQHAFIDPFPRASSIRLGRCNSNLFLLPPYSAVTLSVAGANTVDSDRDRCDEAKVIMEEN